MSKKHFAADPPTVVNGADPVITSPAIVDPFDVRRLKRPGRAGLSTVSRPVTIEVRKPDKTWWVRVHPTDELLLTLLEDRSEKEIGGSLYWIDPDLEQHPLLATEVDMHLTYRAITSLGVEFPWPVKVAREGKELNKWPESAHRVAGEMREQWLRLMTDIAGGRYVSGHPLDPDAFNELVPQWSSAGLSDLMKMAFGSRHITDIDHPVLRRRLGRKVQP